MERWAGKVAVVTGAAGGMGSAISADLVKHGVKVFGMDIQKEGLEKLAVELGKDRFYFAVVDLAKEKEIQEAFKRVEKELGGCDILINNAGCASSKFIIDSTVEESRKVLDVNLMAYVICAQEYVKSVRKRNVPGHIVCINSLAGHYGEAMTLSTNTYVTSKHGVTGLVATLRYELMTAKINVKVTSISPGLVDTPLPKSAALKVDEYLSLQASDISDAVMYVLGTPQHAQVMELIITPTNSKLPFSSKTD